VTWDNRIEGHIVMHACRWHATGLCLLCVELIAYSCADMTASMSYKPDCKEAKSHDVPACHNNFLGHRKKRSQT
jgi:hypothetical protein